MSRLLCYVFGFGFGPGFSSFLNFCGLSLSFLFLLSFELTIERLIPLFFVLIPFLFLFKFS